jgi:hypothetical protein
MTETTSSTVSPTTPKRLKLNVADIVRTLKAAQPEHPALRRLRAKLVAGETQVAISRYDRMHHRHNRS